MVVALIATWNDGEQLARAVASCAPYVDGVVVLDGAYAGIDGEQHSPPADLGAAHELGALIAPAASAPWPDEIAKRNVLLELGRSYHPSAQWALVLDADEQLVGGGRLRELLHHVEHDGPARQSVPIVRTEPNGDPWNAPSRLFRLTSTVRYAGKSFVLDYDGLPVDLSHSHAIRDGHDLGVVSFGVTVAHRWDLRTTARQRTQRMWGRELARLDGGAEPVA